MAFISHIFFTFILSVLFASCFFAVYKTCLNGISQKYIKNEKVSFVADLFLIHLFVQSFIYLAFKVAETIYS